ncbi:decarboxylase [Paenibacillus sp. FSL R5-0527]|uniref:decarboxylase n=1 Tax=Paenibacillus sp. FSL R5-0527 TaxID=2975321 RepID=UPI0026CFA3AE
MDYEDLRARYGSPFYLYDLKILRHSCSMLRQALPNPAILFYSLKANPHPLLVQELLNLGCWAEVSSLGELHVVLEAGGDKADILYTGPGKSRAELQRAVEMGVRWFSVESLTELEKLRSVAIDGNPPLQAIMRINPDQEYTGAGLAMTGTPSQFGTDEQALLRELKKLHLSENVQIAGFHIFNGTNTGNFETLSDSFLSSIQVMARLARECGIKLKFVDLGGGFGYPYAVEGSPSNFGGLKVRLESALDDLMPGWRSEEPSIAFESGRYLAAASGTLVSTVMDIKESKGSRFIILDSGIHHLGGMAGLGRIPRVQYDILPVSEMPADRHEPAKVVGPLCTPLDFFNKSARMPALRPGDLVYVPNVGAYGITASLLGFLSREMPVEIVVDGDEIKQVSQLTLNRIEK